MIAQAILEKWIRTVRFGFLSTLQPFGIKRKLCWAICSNAKRGKMMVLEMRIRLMMLSVHTHLTMNHCKTHVAVWKQGHFAGAWKSNTSSYQDATAALTGVYATDTSYYAKAQ